MKNVSAIVEKGWRQFVSSTDKAYLEIKDYVQFDFSIMYQPSDGPVLEYADHNAPLDKCCEIIKEKGTLSLEDYLDVCI